LFFNLFLLIFVLVLKKNGGALELTGVIKVRGHVVRCHLWLKSTVVKFKRQRLQQHGDCRYTCNF